MIVEYFGIGFSVILESILTGVPVIELVIPENILSGASEVFRAVTFLFPVYALLPIPIISISMDLFQITMAILVRVKSFIPTMGA